MDHSLPQSLYLLCYTVNKEKFELTNLQGRGQLLRAGALTELTRAGLLEPRGSKVVRLPGHAPDDPFIDAVWQDVPADRPKSWIQFVHAKAHTAEKPVRQQLVAAGAITVESEKRLGLLPLDRVVVSDPRLVRGLQERVRGAVLGAAAPSALPTDDLAMAVFAAEVEVTSVLTGKERRAHKQRLKELAAHYDGVVPGLRKALRDSYLSSRAVGGGWSA